MMKAEKLSTLHPHISPENEERIDALLVAMTLEEKIGQMTQPEKTSIPPEDVARYLIGSVLSGGGGNPTPNTPQDWREMVQAFQDQALQTRLKIPLIYGVDAVHGHNNVRETVLFPHNIALGAADDVDLVERIGAVTAAELLATSVHWTFAPAVSVPYDMRWGRTFEGYSEDTERVSRLAGALIKGLQGYRPDHAHGTAGVAACAKHFVADGATQWGTRRLEAWMVQQTSDGLLQTTGLTQQIDDSQGQWQIDQGVSAIDEAELRAVHLPPYKAAIEEGVLTIMVSYSSWNGLKMHAQRYLLMDVLKGELGFDGLLVTDWLAIDQIDPDYYTCVVTSLNAGIDMVMVPYDYKKFITTTIQAVKDEAVSMTRIDDAVRRILRVKFALGLFDAPYGDDALMAHVGSPAHRAVAREAVQKTQVLLKNDQVLPLAKKMPALLVAGRGADDIGLQCGGWSISWQGDTGATTPGTTILEGIREAVDATTQITYAPEGAFADGVRASVAIVVLHEEPYAEGFGDRADLSLSADEVALLERVRAQCDKLVVILLAGRARIITEQLPLMDALVMAWLPGTEGQGIADVIFGDVAFTGKLPMHWARSMAQIPLKALRADEEAPLFAAGYGLT